MNRSILRVGALLSSSLLMAGYVYFRSTPSLASDLPASPTPSIQPFPGSKSAPMVMPRPTRTPQERPRYWFRTPSPSPTPRLLPSSKVGLLR